MEKIKNGYDSKVKNYLFKIVNIDTGKPVKVNGEIVKTVSGLEDLNGSGESSFFDAEKNVLLIK